AIVGGHLLASFVKLAVGMGMTTSVPSRTPAPQRGRERRDRLAASMQMFSQPFVKHAASPLYLVNLVIVSVVMLVLPLMYVALIGAVAYFVLLYATGQL